MIGYVDICGLNLIQIENFITDEISDNWEINYNAIHWFDIVKAISLVLGLVTYIGLYFISYQYNWIIYIGQWVLFANVLEIAILAFLSGHYCIGLVILLVSPFSPMLKVNKNGIMCAEKGNIFSFMNFDQLSILPIKWYYRLYYIGIGTAHLFVKHFEFSYQHLFLSCYVPLIISECKKTKDLYSQFFSIRTFAIFQGTFCRLGGMWTFSIDQRFIKKSKDQFNTGISIFYSCLFIGVSLLLCYLNDKYRGESSKEEQNSKNDV
jgi:hypothetical protein